MAAGALAYYIIFLNTVFKIPFLAALEIRCAGALLGFVSTHTHYTIAICIFSQNRTQWACTLHIRIGGTVNVDVINKQTKHVNNSNKATPITVHRIHQRIIIMIDKEIHISNWKIYVGCDSNTLLGIQINTIIYSIFFEFYACFFLSLRFLQIYNSTHLQHKEKIHSHTTRAS